MPLVPFFLLALAFLTIWTSYTDTKTGLISDTSTLILALIGLSWSYVSGLFPDSLLSALILALGSYSIQKIYIQWRGKPGLGFGDVKLFAAMGFWIPPEKIPLLLISCGLLGIISHIIWTIVKTLNKDQASKWQEKFPFAPSIYIALLVYFYVSFG